MKFVFSHPQLYEGQTGDHTLGRDMLGLMINLLMFEASDPLGVLVALVVIWDARVRDLSAYTDTHARSGQV